MKENRKILITSVLNQLQRRDPAWAHANLQPKFKALYDGWAAVGVRHHRHNRVYYTRKWRDGWLPEEEYLDFLKYAWQ